MPQSLVPFSILTAVVLLFAIPSFCLAGESWLGSGVPTAGYAGASACKPCHASQYAAWSSSLHAAAMRPVDARNGASLSGGETAATFGPHGASHVEFRCKQNICSAEVTGGGGQPKSFDLRYLFGQRPIEQFLAATDKGRLQALPVGYDTNRDEWFDIFAGEERLPGDFGHWLGRGMNANSQCSDCHTTGYRKGYDVASDSYDSRLIPTLDRGRVPTLGKRVGARIDSGKMHSIRPAR